MKRETLVRYIIGNNVPSKTVFFQMSDIENIFVLHNILIVLCYSPIYPSWVWVPLAPFSVMRTMPTYMGRSYHDDAIKWKHFPRYWPFVQGIHRSTMNSPHKGQWRAPFMFSLSCTWIDGWVNNSEAGDLRRYRAHYDVIVMNTVLKLGGSVKHNVCQQNGSPLAQLMANHCINQCWLSVYQLYMAELWNLKKLSKTSRYVSPPFLN